MTKANSADNAERVDRRRLLVIGHEYHFERFQRGWYEALGEVFDLVIHKVEAGWPFRFSDLPDTRELDACMWYVRFDDLYAADPFAWEGFGGLKILYDEDTHLNYFDVAPHHEHGRWPEAFERHAFELLVSTGKAPTEALVADGVATCWLPKAYSPERLFDKGEDRDGICYFGARYPARRAMLRYLSRAGIEISTFSSDGHDALNDHLNQYLGNVICNMVGQVSSGAWRYINRLWPTVGIRLAEGPETMLKNFETAGAGCAPICDYIPELDDLGFIDGENMVSYRSFEELESKLRHYLNAPDELARIGKAAHELARNRHTWHHRAKELDSVIQSRLAN